MALMLKKQFVPIRQYQQRLDTEIENLKEQEFYEYVQPV